jgi:hypothetical protein
MIVAAYLVATILFAVWVYLVATARGRPPCS